MAGPHTISLEELRAIATFQKAVLTCILFNLGLYCAQFALPEETQPLMQICSVITSIVSTGFVALLAIQLHNKVLGVVLGVLTLIPVLGLIVLLVSNSNATGLLRRHGFTVGLFGARLSDLS